MITVITAKVIKRISVDIPSCHFEVILLMSRNLLNENIQISICFLDFKNYHFLEVVDHNTVKPAILLMFSKAVSYR